ncbi:Crp/Fnr family transcriptional regulator [Sphingomonas sp. R86520]|uniref:Crp/Fnr family transcriptional regulator n=1 Tax=Sphingomonas sp. R86520 TaxID=3093859 RepID=UPI0036D3BA88
MRTNDNDIFGSVIQKLGRLGELGKVEQDAIRRLPATIETASNHAFLVREGMPSGDCYLLLAGYVCRHKVASNGGRQIVSFHMAGDIVDLQHLFFATADHSVQAITEVKYAQIPSLALRRLAKDYPLIAEALWRDTLVDASVFREWVLNIGQRDAKSRVAHMLCEFAIRREAAGLGSPERFDLPMSQEQIGDATGLTSVHVNRMLRALGEDGVIDRDKRDVRITDWKRLRDIGGFDPMYLHNVA